MVQHEPIVKQDAAMWFSNLSCPGKMYTDQNGSEAKSFVHLVYVVTVVVVPTLSLHGVV